jgi:hypothetical protein
VTCPPETFCTSADSMCHCGGRDGPICRQATCAVYTGNDGCQVGFCIASQPCDSVICASAFETCDPSTGNCLCGPITDAGPLPPQCSDGFFCGSFDGGVPPQCFQPCDPYAQNCPALTFPPDGGEPDSGAPDGSIAQACYYEPWMNALVCEPVLRPRGNEAFSCTENDDCPTVQLGSLACFPLTPYELDAGYARACRFYCDTFADGGHRCPAIPRCLTCPDPVRECVPIAIVDAGGTPFAVGACQPPPP